MKLSIVLPVVVFGKETRTNQELLGALSTVQETLEANMEFSSANLTKNIMDFRLKANKRDIRLQHSELRQMVAMGVNFSFKQLLSAFLRGIRVDQRELTEEQEDKWCGYGCYCTPTQKHLAESDWVGHGDPVDPIDALCMQLWKCYQCLDLEYDKCPPSTPYGWKGMVLKT